MFENNNIKKKLENLKSKKILVEDNANYFLQNIEKYNKEYNIVLDLKKEEALKKAEILDKKKENFGKLYGLCFLIKSNLSKKGFIISCASKTLENYEGSFDSDVVRFIEEEDGIILGNLNCDEFASGGTGKSSAFKTAKNILSQNRIPGGSSSGSASCIMANFCDISLGTDTGGSIRNPASCQGIFGIKPSYGRVSRYGLLDLAMSFDTIGVLSKDIFACALSLEVISKKTNKDSNYKNKEIFPFSNCLKNFETKKKVGIIKNFDKFIKEKKIKEEFFSLIEKLKQKNFEIIEIEIDKIGLSVETYYPIVYSEFFSATRKFDGIKYGKVIEENINSEVKRRIEGGREITKSEHEGAYYKKALKIKKIITDEFEKAFKKVDFIILPTLPIFPPKLEQNLTTQEEYAMDIFTTSANVSGMCAGNVSKIINFQNEKISIGFQVLANKFDEKTMFQAMFEIDEILNS